MGIFVFSAQQENIPLEALSHVKRAQYVMKMLYLRDVLREAQLTPENVNVDKVFRAVVLFAIFAVEANTSLVLVYWMKVVALYAKLANTRQVLVWWTQPIAPYVMLVHFRAAVE